MAAADLLPPNATALMRAASLTAARIIDVPTEQLRILKDPATCPLALLPYLALERGVKAWDSSWSEATQRAVVAGSYAVRAHAGTRGALQRALAQLGMSITLQEWFQYGGAPYRFRLGIQLGSGGTWSVADQKLVTRTVRGAKNVRSRLESLQLTTSGPKVPVLVGAVAHSRIRIRPSVSPITAISGRAPVRLGAVVHSRLRIRPAA